MDLITKEESVTSISRNDNNTNSSKDDLTSLQEITDWKKTNGHVNKKVLKKNQKGKKNVIKLKIEQEKDKTQQERRREKKSNKSKNKSRL